MAAANPAALLYFMPRLFIIQPESAMMDAGRQLN
jgi:hypothetical protein